MMIEREHSSDAPLFHEYERNAVRGTDCLVRELNHKIQGGTLLCLSGPDDPDHGRIVNATQAIDSKRIADPSRQVTAQFNDDIGAGYYGLAALLNVTPSLDGMLMMFVPLEISGNERARVGEDQCCCS